MHPLNFRRRRRGHGLARSRYRELLSILHLQDHVHVILLLSQRTGLRFHFNILYDGAELFLISDLQYF